jgi:hypothetical protein
MLFEEKKLLAVSLKEKELLAVSYKLLALKVEES